MNINKFYGYFFLILTFLLGANSKAYALAWQRLDIGIGAQEAKAIAIDPRNASIIYAGFKEGLYRSEDQGKSWQLLGAGLVDDINSLFLDAQQECTIYAATKNGLFRSQDEGINWQRIFSGKDVLEKDVLAITLCRQSPKVLFIATRGGLFFSPVNRIVWQKVSGKLNDASISSIITDPNTLDTIYIISNKGLFRSENRTASYEGLYGGFNPEPEDSSTDIDSEEEESGVEEYFLKSIAIDPQNSNNLYLGSSQGLISSLDGGRTWKRQELGSLLDRTINYILVSNMAGRFFLATGSGVFDCSQGSCKQLYKGMDFKNCNYLAEDTQGNLYAAADKGLFKILLTSKEKSKKPELTAKMYEKYSSQEPTIQQIHKEAIRYAEVCPEKIAAWRRQARLRALIPELTLDYDKTVTTALGATYDRVQVGPRDWGLNLKWDLADLIFSTDQTSIDVRSRLMVQLRDEILDQVNRVYFERKRLKSELAAQANLDDSQKFEKELRLEELTAALDGLTGGYMTRRLNSTREQNF